MLRAVSLVAALLVLPFDAEHPCSWNAVKKAKLTATNHVLGLLFIIILTVFMIVVLEKVSNRFCKNSEKELSNCTITWLINVAINRGKKQFVCPNKY